MSFLEQFPEPVVQPSFTLGERIAYWQAIFDNIPYDNSSTEALRIAAAEDLDSYLTYDPGWCAFSGDVAEEVGTLGRNTQQKKIAYSEGNSYGLAVVRIGKSLMWRVCYDFEEKISGNNGQSVSRHVFLLPETAKIVPFDRVDRAFDNVRIPHFILDEAAELMSQDANDSDFLKLDASDQKYIIDGKLFEVRAKAQKWGGVEKPVMIGECDLVYVATDFGPGEHTGFRSFFTRKDVLTGNCIGLDVLARFQLGRDKPIRCGADLVNEQAGLYLSVAIDSETASILSLKTGDCIYVPIGGNSFELTFLENEPSEESRIE